MTEFRDANMPIICLGLGSTESRVLYDQFSKIDIELSTCPHGRMNTYQV